MTVSVDLDALERHAESKAEAVRLSPDEVAALVRAVRAANDEHEERCDCDGEACELGAALAPFHTEAGA